MLHIPSFDSPKFHLNSCVWSSFKSCLFCNCSFREYQTIMPCIIYVLLISQFSLSNFIPVLKEPPFLVKEQGYAGFTILVEIYFKGVNDGDTEKMVRKLIPWNWYVVRYSGKFHTHIVTNQKCYHSTDILSQSVWRKKLISTSPVLIIRNYAGLYCFTVYTLCCSSIRSTNAKAWS